MEKNQQIAASVLELVGGKENISFVTHCMTRLRLNLKDESIVDDEKVKKIKGVLGIAHSGGQYQIIIGQNVPKVYKAVCETGGFQQEAAIEENLDQPKEKLTLKTIGSNIMNYMSGAMTQLIGVMIGAAMFKTVLVLIGPDMLKLISVESDTYLLLNAIYNAFYYFLPVFLGYSAAKKLGTNVTLGMMMGTLLLVPDFVSLIGTKESISIYGLLNAPVQSYAQSVLPILLAVAIMSVVETFFKKVVPDVLSTIFVPTLTIAVMVPLLFCVCGPIGGYIGAWVGDLLIGFGDVGGFVAVAVVAALWEFLVMTGMHAVLITFAITTMLQTGSDSFVLVAGGIATWSAFGMALGAFFKQKKQRGESGKLWIFRVGYSWRCDRAGAVWCRHALQTTVSGAAWRWPAWWLVRGDYACKYLCAGRDELFVSPWLCGRRNEQFSQWHHRFRAWHAGNRGLDVHLRGLRGRGRSGKGRGAGTCIGNLIQRRAAEETFFRSSSYSIQ